MCGVCGCGDGETRIDGDPAVQPRHSHDRPIGHHHHGGGDDHHSHDAGGHLHFGADPALAAMPGMSHSRIVQVEQDILSKNDAYAARNRARFIADGILALNLVSSPGAGKTTLLTATIEVLKGAMPIGVIEGDQETANDAERIRETGVPAVQINTGRGCHLDAHMVGHALDRLALAPAGILFIENVGNLVCPAAFDLGENHKVAILSVTEGEDKPLKYPDMFAAADVMILGKIDLLPHLDFDADRCVAYARRINPDIEVLRLSARTGEGMEDWISWIRRASAGAEGEKPSDQRRNLRAAG